jgi:phosphopantetheinyl transferase
MERFSKLQLNQLMAVKKQTEARLARTTIIALTNEWRQRQNMRNYQSEYDRIRNELSNSALPF